MRKEHDLLGEVEIPENVLWGIHTARSLENFSFTRGQVSSSLKQAMGVVKLACAQESVSQGAWQTSPEKAAAILEACAEVARGELQDAIVVHSIQGGAGTSLNMNVNEVIANRAIQILGGKLGDHALVSPLDDINLHQSTNDVFPTAVRIAIITELQPLLEALTSLRDSFLGQKQKCAQVIKVGRTQYQDAVLTTLGNEMNAYASAISRDIIRISNCMNELYSVNLGGTAIGTGFGAPPEYIHNIVPRLAKLTQLPLVQAVDLVDGTQNLDVFASLSGELNTLCANLIKISTDLRFLSSGPEAGIGEIILPARQAGSSIMPGKVNPVIPEVITQMAMLIMGHDATIHMAVSSGHLELNAFLPLISTCLLHDLACLRQGCVTFQKFCIDGIQPNPEGCQRGLRSSTALITALVPRIGYEKASTLAEEATQDGKSIRQKLLESKSYSEKDLDNLFSDEII